MAFLLGPSLAAPTAPAHRRIVPPPSLSLLQEQVLQPLPCLSPSCLPAGHQSVVSPSLTPSYTFPSQAGDGFSHCSLSWSIFSFLDADCRLPVIWGRVLGCAPSRTELPELLTPSLSPCSSAHPIPLTLLLRPSASPVRHSVCRGWRSEVGAWSGLGAQSSPHACPGEAPAEASLS